VLLLGSASNPVGSRRVPFIGNRAQAIPDIAGTQLEGSAGANCSRRKLVSTLLHT
jgi:hypothetical protein